MFFDRAQASMLTIPSSVWKVWCFHYSLSHFAVFLHRGPGVGAMLCGLVSPDPSSAGWGSGTRHTWVTCGALVLLNWT